MKVEDIDWDETDADIWLRDMLGKIIDDWEDGACEVPIRITIEAGGGLLVEGVTRDGGAFTYLSEDTMESMYEDCVEKQREYWRQLQEE